uniref:Uncharacterized protein n=1 Tax=Rhizophora mucronata TaxID=61149 RepID=A0A2P2R3C8_RHIMU
MKDHMVLSLNSSSSSSRTQEARRQNKNIVPYLFWS